MSGFVPMDAEWWPFVRASLAKPWPKEAAMFDLRWHADRVHIGAGEMPGRPALALAWGWTDWAVKQLLRGQEWVDVWKLNGDSPANRQRTASAPPAAAKANAEKSPKTTSPPPAGRQQTAIARVSLGTLHPSPSTGASLSPSSLSPERASSSVERERAPSTGTTEHSQPTEPPATAAPRAPTLAPAAADLPTILGRQGHGTKVATLLARSPWAITTIEQLLRRTARELRFSGLGEARSAWLVERLAAHGLELQPDPSDRPKLLDDREFFGPDGEYLDPWKTSVTA